MWRYNDAGADSAAAAAGVAACGCVSLWEIWKEEMIGRRLPNLLFFCGGGAQFVYVWHSMAGKKLAKK